MKKLLIITGPQGSGNHVFSRIFSIHPEVSGWESLIKKYWVPSDEEPFAEFWVHPERLTEEVFENSNYFFANVSCPFFYDGQRYIPKILEVAERAKSFGVDVQIALIVRDQNINAEQQLRVRGEVTTPISQDYYYNTLLNSDFKVNFLDNEALFLHREHYLKWVSKLLQFPVDYDNPDVFEFITEDPNKKYIKYVEQYWLDEEVWNGVKSKKERCIDDVETMGKSSR